MSSSSIASCCRSSSALPASDNFWLIRLFLQLLNQPMMAASNENARPVFRCNSSNQNRRSLSGRRMRPSAMIALLLIAIAGLLPTSKCATFFYGATEDSNQAIGQLETAADERTLALAENAAESENEMDEAKLSSQELESVYKFCSLLPLLEESGHVVKNKQAREVCDKLVAMLKPMFRKRNKPIRPRRGMIVKRRR